MILSQIHHVNWLRNLGIAVQWSYSERHFWWSGVELFRRLVFLILTIIPAIYTVESIDTQADYHYHTCTKIYIYVLKNKCVCALVRVCMYLS